MFWPRTDIALLRRVIVAVSALLFLLGLYTLFASGFGLFGWGFFTVMALTAVFLWRLHPLACGVAKFVLAMAIVIPILGIFNPFMAMDYAAENHGEMPPWGLIAARMAPHVLVAFFCYGVLDRHRAQFGRKPQEARQAS